jgi:hypothetical protein
MAEGILELATHWPPAAVSSASASAWETTAGSIIHRPFRQLERVGGSGFTALKLYIIAVAMTFIPLLIGALLSPLSLTTPSQTHRLPFLCDWNVLFMFLVSFPCLVILTVSDYHFLGAALKSIESDGTIVIAQSDYNRLNKRWSGVFKIVNIIGQVLGIVVGGIIAYFNFVVYSKPSVGFWIAENGHLLPVGFVFLYCIFLFYAVVPVYAVRNIAISLFFKDIVAHAELHMLPLHPDKCGGLRPVGRLGLRNQYALTMLGLNLVLLVVISRIYLTLPDVAGLIVAAIVAYLVLGPVVFMGPLLPFRSGMLRNKSQLMSEVAQRLRVELDRLREQLRSGSISKKDEELIERLRKIGAVIDELPVWPFDAGTLRKFLTAYVIPVVSGLAIPLGKMLFHLAD